jgi:hypothetical protein
LLLAASILFGTSAYAAGAQVGSVEKIINTVHLERPPSTQPTTPVEKSIVEENDTFITEPASGLILDLDGDGGGGVRRLTVGESATVTISQNLLGPTGSRSTLIGLTLGELRSVVPKLLGGSFIITSPNASAGVTGTDFVVTVTRGQTRPDFGSCLTFTDVVVYSGVVRVASLRNPAASVSVESGHYTTVACENAPLEPLASNGRSGFQGNAAEQALLPPSIPASIPPPPPPMPAPVAPPASVSVPP